MRGAAVKTRMRMNSYLLIDSTALTANVKAIREELGGAKLVPVLKCDAYGLGAVEMARLLGEQGIDTFAVSHVSEGLQLRDAGIEATIWVMSIPLDFQLRDAAEAGLVLTLGSFRQFEIMKETAEAVGRPVSVQLKLDTGLHRIGFLQEEIPALAQAMEEYSRYLHCTGCFSHFRDSIEADMDEQLELFLTMTGDLKRRGVETGLLHMSSSASLEKCAKYNLDAVRIGRRLYMDHPFMPTGRIREAASLRAYLADIRQRKAGETLGYDQGYLLTEDKTVGVLSVGYGDGLSPDLYRLGEPVLVNGVRARLLACCMDQSFVDLSGIACQPGDEVTFFGYDAAGNFLSAQQIANDIGANEGCALTSALHSRVARVIR